MYTFDIYTYLILYEIKFKHTFNAQVKKLVKIASFNDGANNKINCSTSEYLLNNIENII